MKNLSLLFIAFLLLQFTVVAQQGWYWQNPLPYGNDLNDVSLIDPNTMIAVGDFGLILKTTNGGLNWSKILTELNTKIDHIKFTDPNNGWLCSDGNLYKTTNQGDDWEIILANSPYGCSDFYFINSDTGWVSGGAILATTDGGQSWQVSIDDPGWYDNIFFLDNYHGWSTIPGGLFNDGKIIKTTDGGINWYESYFAINHGRVYSMHFIDTSTGWIVYRQLETAGGKLAKTTDGGANWFIQLQSLNEKGFSYVKFLDENIGYACGGYSLGGEIVRTTNGGADWTTQFLNNAIQLNSIQFFNNEINYEIGCVVGNSGAIFTSEDGGVNWLERSSATTRFDIQSVHFIDKNKGWACGYGYSDFPYEMRSVIINTNNGGGNWNLVLRDTTDRLSSVYFINDLVGFAAGSKIIKTIDAGNSWQTVDTGRSITDIQFIDDNIGYAAGDQQILKTSNGGDSWELNSNNGSSEIHFTNADTGWAVGGSYPYYIYNTTNGGSAWYVQYTSNEFIPKSVYFVNSEIGWVVDGGSNIGGKILKTTNGGITWDQQITGHSANRFTSVHFEDENSGWVIGNWGGVILRTTNGGTDWTEQKSGSNSWLNDIYFVDQSTGWIVGDGGVILSTTNGGVTFVEEEKTNEVPETYFLSNNFPNPFNPSTKIKYSVPQSSQVQIKLFDVLGNEIETLVNQEKPVGTYELNWNAANLPSGVYFYRLQAGDYVQTRKMILLK